MFYQLDSKLRERIKATISQQKAAPLVPERSTREWLIHLRSSTAPPKTSVLQAIKVEYKKLVGVGLDDWPPGGPGSWLAKWEDLLYRSAQNGKQIDDWLEDVSLVWINVKEVNFFFNLVETNLRVGNTAQYSYASIVAELQQTWERKRQGQSLCRTRSRTTRSAFATDVMFDGEEALDGVETVRDTAAVAASAATATPATAKKSTARKSKSRNKKKKDNQTQHRSQSNQDENRSQSSSPTHRRRSRLPASRPSKSEKRASRNGKKCIACDGDSHSYKRCFLVLGEDKDWISEERRVAFRKNMKDKKMKEKVDSYKQARETLDNSFDQ